jgi:hypothetical protein
MLDLVEDPGIYFIKVIVNNHVGTWLLNMANAHI